MGRPRDDGALQVGVFAAGAREADPEGFYLRIRSTVTFSVERNETRERKRSYHPKGSSREDRS